MDTAAAEWMNELALNSGLGGSQEKSDKDTLWVGELTDKLTIAIALREWDNAVALVEEGWSGCTSPLVATTETFDRRGKESYSAVIRDKIETLTFFINVVASIRSCRPKQP